MSEVQTASIKHWLNENCKGHFRSRKNNFMFERESDAVNFSLRWS